MSNFNQFISTIKANGVAKSSHFFCDILPPRSMIQTTTPVQTILPFYVESISLPEMALSTLPIKDYGLNREVVFDKNYGSCVLTMTSDQNMTIKSFFDNWIQSTVIRKGGIFTYPDSYIAETLTVYQVDQSKNVTYVVIMNNAYPKIVDDVGLQYNSRNPLTFRVQFTFESWDSYQFSTFDPTAPITKDNSENITRAWNYVKLIRSGANKDAVRSSLINVGTRKIYDLIGQTGIDAKVKRGVDDLIGKSGIGSILETIDNLF